MFITFEGPEGSGKTTQIAMLAEALRARGHVVIATREPGGTPLGDRIRDLLLDSVEPIAPETEAYLMTAARAEHVRRIIKPALQIGAIVISDRFVDSTLAYQGAGRGLPIAELAALQEFAVGRLRPDLTILLDIDVPLGLARRGAAGGVNRIDREDVLFHQRVAEWYRMAAANDRQRWVVISGADTPSEVHHAVLMATEARLPRPACAGQEEFVR